MDHKQERNLVDELALRNQVLFATYKKTEEVAINRWYPGISAKNGSTNSYPHVQGVIQQLSLVVYHPQCAVVLTDAELYLLLTSILLHDIGKVETTEDHGSHSKMMIQSHWAELKIENEQMHHIIQNICLLHDRRDADFVKTYQKLPVDEYIDRYGKVRPRLLGALLYLGDHMDDSYTRTMSNGYTNHFRRYVLGVHFQPEQQLITTVIDPDMFISTQEKKLHPACEACFLAGIGALGKFITPDTNQQDLPEKKFANLDVNAIRYLLQDTFDNDTCLRNVLNELYVLGMPIKKWMIECKGQLFLVLKHDEPQLDLVIDGSDLAALLATQNNPSNGEAHDSLVQLKDEYNIESVQRETKETSCLALNRFCDILKIVRSQPVHECIIEQIRQAEQTCSCKQKEAGEMSLTGAFQRMQSCPYGPSKTSHLHMIIHPQYYTALSFEPLTGYYYCAKVLAGMYEITSTIFAKSFFSYTDLCNYLREDPNNTRKVMSAVRRLSFLFQYMAEFDDTKPDYRYEIYYDDQVWNLKNTVCAGACSLGNPSARGTERLEAHQANMRKICYIRPTPDNEPNALLKIQREHGSIADWTKELE